MSIRKELDAFRSLQSADVITTEAVGERDFHLPYLTAVLRERRCLSLVCT